MDLKEIFDADDVESFEKSCNLTSSERWKLAHDVKQLVNKYENESANHSTNRTDRQKWKNTMSYIKLYKELTDINTDFGMHALSERLSELADRMGYTEEAREMFIETTKVHTVCLNISVALCGEQKSCRVVGSKAEGTRKFNSRSDIDILIFNPLMSVKQSCQNQESNMPYLRMIEDNVTPPGYVKLQLLHNGHTPNEKNIHYYKSFYLHKLIIDKSRVYVSNEFTDKEAKIHQSLELEKHGPAVTLSVSNETRVYEHLPVDHVSAYVCNKLPAAATSWFKRKRRYGWPSEETIQLFKQMGCVLVATGHQNSPEQKRQWRLSFLNQEMHLMHNLNTTQYKCYVILKHFRNVFIKDTLNDSLCSYHLKTALFYTIETSTPNIWQPKYLAYVVLKCLHKLREWIADLNCPNYFIPQENMFETKLNQEKKGKLINIFTYQFDMRLCFLRLLSYTYQCNIPCKTELLQNCLYHIQVELRVLMFEFAEYMKTKGYPENTRIINKIIQCLTIITDDNTTTLCQRLSGYIAFPEVLLAVFFMKYAGTYDFESRLQQFLNEMPKFPDIHPILNSSPLRSAFSLFKSSLNSKLVSYTLMNCQQLTEKDRDKLFDFVNHHVQKAGQANAINSRLQQASYLYIDRQHMLVDVILEKSIRTEFNMSKLCGACFHLRGFTKNSVKSDVRNNQFQEVLQKLEVHELTVDYIISITRTCLTFDSMETIMVPAPLQYETLKTFGTSIHLNELVMSEDLSLIVIDQIVYLFYLWYKNKDKMDDTPGMELSGTYICDKKVA